MEKKSVIKVTFTNFEKSETGLLVSKVTNINTETVEGKPVDHVVLYTANNHGGHGLVYCEMDNSTNMYKATVHGNKAVLDKLKYYIDSKPNNAAVLYLSKKRKARSRKAPKVLTQTPTRKKVKSNNGWALRHNLV